MNNVRINLFFCLSREYREPSTYQPSVMFEGIQRLCFTSNSQSSHTTTTNGLKIVIHACHFLGAPGWASGLRDWPLRTMWWISFLGYVLIRVEHAVSAVLQQILLRRLCAGSALLFLRPEQSWSHGLLDTTSLYWCVQHYYDSR